MNKIKYAMGILANKNHGYALGSNKDQALSHLITHSSFSKIALAIGLAFSAPAVWANCDITDATVPIPCTGSGDVISNIGGNNTITVYGPAGSHIFSINASSGNATLNLTGSLNMVNDQGGHGLYVDSQHTTGTSLISVVGTHSIQIGGSTGKTAITATSKAGSTVQIQNNLNITNGSTAQDSHGIDVIAQDSGNAILEHQGQGTISTTNGHVISMQANGTTGDILVDLNGSGIQLEAGGDGSHGINALAGTNNTNSSITINSKAHIKTNGNDAHGIYAASSADAGDITVTTSNSIFNLNGQNNNGIYVEATNATGSAANLTVNTNGGTIDLSNVSAASTGGNYGIIVAHRNGAATGNIAITNNGTNIITAQTIDTGAAIYGAFENSASVGHITIINHGELTTTGQNVYGIHGENLGTGNVAITNTKNITTANATGIQALAQSGNVAINYGSGTIKVAGTASSGGNAFGISAQAEGTGNATADAKIELTSGAIVDASQGVGALHLSSVGTGTIDIASGVQVKGGHSVAAADKGYAINIYSTSATDVADFKINNAGYIEALSDQFIRSNSIADSTLDVTNHAGGNMNGYLTFGDENSTVTNSGIWNIRHFADTTGNGIRDTKAVSVSDFGAGNDIIKNEVSGTINLSDVPLTTRAAVNYDANYVGYQTAGALDISSAGIVQGHLVNVTRFENRGTINLTDNGRAGDVLVITGNATAMNTSGNSTFMADGGSVKLDTVLNEGGANSLSDILVVDNVEAGTQKTQLIINHVDGTGAVTEGDGIKVVEVLGTAASGSFELGNVVKSGLYEYTLFEGSQTTAGDDSLFLRSSISQINPDVGSYLINQAAATGLFMHTLHDRLGEPQYYENYLSEDKTIPALWIRAVSGHTKNEAAGGRLKQHSVESLIHLGGELANWTRNGEDRYHFGVMGAYGRSEGKTKSQVTGNRVDSTVGGYGVGAYLTWYDKPASVEGWYGDLWSMYNWFENKTEGSDNYDSTSWTVSLEAGYATKLKTLENYYWMLEPQAQVAFHRYDVDKIKDHNGLDIINHDKNSLTTRLGVRTYLRPNELYKNSAQPFLELNWWGNDNKHSLMFNGEKVSNDTPRNRFEVKVGVQGEMTKNVQIYSHIGMQWGKNSYEHTEGQLGLRYRF